MRFGNARRELYIKHLSADKTKTLIAIAPLLQIYRRHDQLSSRLFVAIIASMIAVGAKAAPGDEPAQPKLVVGIVVEDLHKEYIDLLSRYFTKGGFNRLLNNGVTLTNVDYGSLVDPATATAIIYTGTSPSINGVASEEIFDRQVLRGVPVFADKDYIGNFTDQSLSPRALLTSTITDEIRIAGDGRTYAYAFAPDAAQALAMAGHAANYGSWINDANLNWATTTYYKDIPAVYNERNRSMSLGSRIESLQWTPALDRVKYSWLLPTHLTEKEFNYTFSKSGPVSVMALKNSPLINTEVTDFAIDHIEAMNLGLHDGPDMINLAYTLEPYAYSKNADNRYEMLDTYYRLDRDLERLFDAIDRQVGMPNTLVFLASTPAVTRSRRDDEKWQIPTGEFSSRRALSLLNLYFISLYGNGSWVQAFHNNQFFLNQDLIKAENKDLTTLRRQAAAFLVQMSGVAEAHSLDDIIDSRMSGKGHPSLHENINVATAGDVRIKVLPGRQLIDDFNNPKAKPDQVARETTPVAPVMIMAPGLARRTIGTPVDARSIAPTVCRLLRIRSPNGSSLAPLDLTD